MPDSARETKARAFTAEELLQLPDDGHRYELVRGQLRVSPAQSRQQGIVAARIGLSLVEHVSARHLGEVFSASTGFLLAPDHVRGCDVAFVSQARVASAGDIDGFWPGPPDLAVEVVSLTDAFVDVQEKVVDWLRAGVRLVLVIDSRACIVTAYRSPGDVRIAGKGDTIDVSDVVAGWDFPAGEVFAT